MVIDQMCDQDDDQDYDQIDGAGGDDDGDDGDGDGDQHDCDQHDGADGVSPSALTLFQLICNSAKAANNI